LLLSPGYVAGCAYRSAFPVFDVPRQVIVDRRRPESQRDGPGMGREAVCAVLKIPDESRPFPAIVTPPGAQDPETRAGA
jgi:hypothetical protein